MLSGSHFYNQVTQLASGVVDFMDIPICRGQLPTEVILLNIAELGQRFSNVRITFPCLAGAVIAEGQDLASGTPELHGADRLHPLYGKTGIEMWRNQVVIGLPRRTQAAVVQMSRCAVVS